MQTHKPNSLCLYHKFLLPISARGAVKQERSSARRMKFMFKNNEAIGKGNHSAYVHALMISKVCHIIYNVRHRLEEIPIPMVLHHCWSS